MYRIWCLASCWTCISPARSASWAAGGLIGAHRALKTTYALRPVRGGRKRRTNALPGHCLKPFGLVGRLDRPDPRTRLAADAAAAAGRPIKLGTCILRGESGVSHASALRGDDDPEKKLKAYRRVSGRPPHFGPSAEKPSI